MVIVVRSVFHEGNIMLYAHAQCYILKSLMLIKPLPRKSVICHYRYFLEINFRFHLKVCDKCYDVLIMSINLKDIAVLNICGADYGCGSD